MSSPTARSLAHARKLGLRADVVERWIPFGNREAGGEKGRGGIRRDLFGGIDLVAITPEGILGIQACAGSSHAARRRKLLEDPDVAPALAAWCAAGGLLEVWSWSKKGKVGKRKLWDLRRERLLFASCTHAPQNDRTDHEAPASILRAPRALPGHANPA